MVRRDVVIKNIDLLNYFNNNNLFIVYAILV